MYVSNGGDFVEIVTSLMKLIEQRESLSKEFIDYYKEKWKNIE